jgi:hypothetical protein
MRPNRSTSRPPKSSNADILIRLALSIGESGSRLEDNFWEGHLTRQLERQLNQGSDAAMQAALEFLYGSEVPEFGQAYDSLAEAIETATESMSMVINGQDHDVLLIACPVLAWSRASIAAGKISADTLAALSNQLHAHVLAPNVKLALVEALFSPDQMPEGYVAIHRLLRKGAQALAAGATTVARPDDWPQAQPFLADSRFLIGLLAVPAGEALFAWQMVDKRPPRRIDCIDEWKKQGAAALAPVLSNCAFEVVEAGAFFNATRAAEREIRGFSVRASVSFLHMALDIAPPTQTAVVARCQDNEYEEYRIGFLRSKDSDVLHGCVWPLLGPEVESTEVPDEIDAALRSAGITNIIHIENILPAEFCPDCGAPMYPNQDGELLHAELPEEMADDHGTHRHLH